MSSAEPQSMPDHPGPPPAGAEQDPSPPGEAPTSNPSSSAHPNGNGNSNGNGQSNGNDDALFNDPGASTTKDYSCLPVYALKSIATPKWHRDLEPTAFAHLHPPQPRATRQADLDKLRAAIAEAKTKYPKGVCFLHFDVPDGPPLQRMPLQVAAWHSSFRSIPAMIYFVDAIGKPRISPVFVNPHHLLCVIPANLVNISRWHLSS
jgi:hypothetical protein